MESGISSYLPLEAIESLNAMPFGWVIVPFAIAALMALVIMSSLPGTITPVSFLSGALLGFSGILVAALGALIGSQILFLLTRRYFGGYMQKRFGARIDSYKDHVTKRGPLYLVGARIGGVPHVLLTASCAATPITARTFGAAMLLGMLPAITLAALAGSAVLSL